MRGGRALALLALVALTGGCATTRDGQPDRGLVELSCLANPDGTLRDCRIEREEPAGQGFGEAALQAAARARVTPRTAERAGAESRIRWTTRFEPIR